MLPKKWANLERQRPRLKIAKWGMGIGAVITVLGIVGLGSLPLGLLILVASGIWTFTLLR